MLPIFIYDSGIRAYWWLAKIYAPFNSKAKQWVKGRADQQNIIARLKSLEGKKIWFHCASLGEYEQAKPVIEGCRATFPDYKIIITFFSPSGYEQRKNDRNADLACYLPIDTLSNARDFIEAMNPALAIFIKYEFWFHFLEELHKRKIPTLLVSGVFRKSQPFFKWYGGLFRKMLGFYTHIFVQDEKSLKLLHQLGIKEVTLSHDTRFDRVNMLKQEAKPIPHIDRFRQNKKLLIGGSTWAAEEKIISEFQNKHPGKIKLIIAPHEISEEHIKSIERLITSKPLRYSATTDNNVEEAKVLIIDSIGILSQLYAHADIAFIGGAFGNGLHNILEAATFGIPVIFGPNIKKFNEAQELINDGGAVMVTDSNSFEKEMLKLLEDDSLREKMGRSSSSYVERKKGATATVMNYLRTLIGSAVPREKQ